MRTSRVWVIGIVAVAMGFLGLEARGAAEGAKVSREGMQSTWPALDQAGGDLAEGRLDGAREGFERVAGDKAALPLMRSLALLGLGETAMARQDAAGARAAWERLAADETLPPVHRDAARRRIEQMERAAKGLAERDPAAYRAKLPAIPKAGVELHVAVAGTEGGDGSEAKPFSSLEKARDAVRAMKKANGGTLPKGGVRVVVHGGEYRVQETFNLSAEDSGTAEAPIVYEARGGEEATLDGGVRITAWQRVSDAKILEKLDPAVRDRVLEANLGSMGVKDLGDATALRGRPELFCDGVPQTLARWPNEGFVKTGEILGTETFKVWNTIAGCKDGKFAYLEDRPSRWTDEPDVRLYGYWFWDWYEEYQKVASIDVAERSFTLARPYSNYGYRKDQRYYAVNVLRELDQPGEWYLDRRTGMIYWLAPEGVEAAKAMTRLSVMSRPFVTMEGVKHVMLLGLGFREGRGDGIHIRGGTDCLVAGCTIRRMGGDGVVIDGGQRHGIFGCVMTMLGCGGTRVAGGDRKTLTPGGHFVENCTVSDISRLKRTYTPAVHLDGCGNRIAHNRFEKMTSSAMRIEGNDHLIELNEIRRVVEESDDQGGIDMFGNPLYRGVVIRWNRWSDIRGGTECGAAGIRLDDMISGVAVYGNLFERCGAVQFGGVQVHGGKDNLIDGNVFLDCHAGVSFSRWGEKRWLESIAGFIKQAGEMPYAARYPELASLTKGADVNNVSRNVFAGCKSVFLRDGGVERTVLNTVASESLDPSTFGDTKTIGKDRRLRRVLFEAIPLKEMGLYDHPWRARERK